MNPLLQSVQVALKNNEQKEALNHIDKTVKFCIQHENGKVFDESKKQTYDSIVKIADKIKFKTALSAKERVLAARYFRTLKNELSGKTVRYDSTVDNKKD